MVLEETRRDGGRRDQRIASSPLPHSSLNIHLHHLDTLYFTSPYTPLIKLIIMALAPKFAGQKLVAKAQPETLHTLELCM